MKKLLKYKYLLILPVTLGLILSPRAADKLSASYYGYSTNNSANQMYPYYSNNQPTYNPYGQTNYGSNNASGQGSFSLTVNAQTFCVGQSPTYTITAPTSWSGQAIYWTSSHNGATSQQTYTLTGNVGQAWWSASGNPWATGDVGQWTKTAMVEGQTQSISLTVQSCGNTNNGSGNSSYTGFGGSVGNGSQTIGGSVGGSTGGTIGSGVGGASGGTFGGSVNSTYGSNNSSNNYPTGSYIDANGYVCSPPSNYNNQPYQAN